MQFSCEARLNGIGTVARITIMIPVLIDDALNGAGAASAVLWVGVTGEPWPGRFSHTFTVDITGRSVYDASFNSGDAVKFSSFLDKTLRGIADDRARQLEELRDELCVAETAAAS